MTQLLKHKSVITCVLKAERCICFFWTLIMHWVTTPTPTSIVPTDCVGAGLANNEPCARLPSPPPVPSSHKQIHKDLIFRRNQSRSALQIALCLSRLAISSHTEGLLCQQSLLQPGSQVLFLLLCAAFTPTLLWRTCLALGLNTS